MEHAEIVYGSTKTYKASVGLSTAFRQWRAKSHCNLVHGYALEFTATFEADHLDATNWVVDFGSLKSFKQWLETMFDHTVLVARDDPNFAMFEKLDRNGVISMRVVKATGCEAAAEMVFRALELWLHDHGQLPRVRVVKLEVREHDGNSAYVRRKDYR